jgi:uncharacterized protein YndB with AHSA1/START domain
VDATDARYGTVTPDDGGGARIEFRRTWPDDSADVWAALTDPARTQRWIGTYDGERRAGTTGTFTMTAEEGSPASALRIAECTEGSRLVLEWPDTGWRVELDLVAQRGGTTLVFVQRLADAAAAPDIATGWHWYLDKLDAELTGSVAPTDWAAFAAEIGPRYGSTPP